MRGNNPPKIKFALWVRLSMIRNALPLKSETPRDHLGRISQGVSNSARIESRDGVAGNGYFLPLESQSMNVQAQRELLPEKLTRDVRFRESDEVLKRYERLASSSAFRGRRDSVARAVFRAGLTVLEALQAEGLA